MCPDLPLLYDIEQKQALEAAVDRESLDQACGGNAAGVRNHPGGPRAASGAESTVPPVDRTVAGQVAARPGIATDADLVQLALAALSQNALVPSGKVRTVVRNGWLILEGEVEARIQRQAAKDAVKRLPGMRGVSNNILIESDVMAQRVSRKIDEAFVRNARLSASRISVTASNHKIILCGTVHSGTEREEAEAAAWAVPGVAYVVNRIRATGSEG